jgi:hypothetical protein
MFPRTLRRAALAAAGVSVLFLLPWAGAAVQASAQKAAPASKDDLTQASFPELAALVRPQAGEWRHLRVRWLTDVVAARRRAAEEDRPLVVLYTGGAGYNEPLGVC